MKKKKQEKYIVRSEEKTKPREWGGKCDSIPEISDNFR